MKCLQSHEIIANDGYVLKGYLWQGEGYRFVLVIEQNEIHVATVNSDRNALQLWEDFVNEKPNVC